MLILNRTLLDLVSGYNFISLDTSVKGTGVCLHADGVLQTDLLSLSEFDNELDRVFAFKKYLIQKKKEYDFKYIFLENTIMGCNYKTARILNILHFYPFYLNKDLDWECKVITKANSEWHKLMKEACNYTPPVVKMKSKIMVADLFSKYGVIGVTSEDELDALGLGIGCVFDLKNQSR